MGSNLPVPNSHCEPLYRQTYNTYGNIQAAGLTQDNRVGNNQKVNNARLTAIDPPKGILAGSVVAVTASNEIGPCVSPLSDSTTAYDQAVGIAVNNALGNPFESSSALGSGKVVYMHGTGTVFQTDIYETKQYDGTTDITYAYGDKLFASRNGLLCNATGLQHSADVDVTPTVAGLGNITVVGILLKEPTSTDPFMTVQMKI